MLKKIATTLVSWLAASLLSFALASSAHSAKVLNELLALGINISWPQRVQFILADLAGLATSYLPIIALALAIGFAVAWQIIKRLQKWHLALFAAAGFCALLTALLAMQPILEITLVAGARGSIGLLLQCAAGASGGVLFALLKGRELNSK